MGWQSPRLLTACLPPPPPSPPSPQPNACLDYGQFDGRLPSIIDGCNVYGAVSRFQVDARGLVISPEQRLYDSQTPISGVPGTTPRACVQFSTHSTPTDIVKFKNGFAIALGDGAAFTGLDTGNLGTGNPCQDTPPYTGAYRCLDPARHNGKSLLLDGATFVPTIYSMGHRNPWRLTVVNDEQGNEQLWEVSR